MTGDKFLYLSQADIEAVGVGMSEIIEVVETAFFEKGEGRVQLPPKPGLHPPMPNSFVNAMPAFIPSLEALGVKWISCFPENYKSDLPYVTGLIILNDPDSGIPICVMDCVWITSKRTAAASAVAAKYLARPESETLGVLGAGVQGFSHLEALKVLFPIEKVLLYDTIPEQMDRYAVRAAGLWPDLQVVKTNKPREAVEQADIVVTAGPILREPHATIRAGWMTEGAFASLVDYDSYWHGDAMAEVAKFVTDDIPQLEHYRGIGYFQNIPPIYGEVGELVAGKKSGRENSSERIMTCNLGLAINDVATASLVFKRALKKGIGFWIPL